MIKRKRITISGRVQGVGFRPAVYRIAGSLGLSGFVYNDTKGVSVELQGEGEKIDQFLSRLQSADKPPLAQIKSCDSKEIEVVENEGGFSIKISDSAGTALSEVSGDIATCGDCLTEMKDVGDFRYNYPFINCTNCGPRYSIVKTIPYDRPNTTMGQFQMCEKCGGQYKDVTDRRFHAQPVACPACGPQIWMTDPSGETILEGTEGVVAQTAAMLRDGKILAIKGIGGFHLAVDATNAEAVKRLRKRKRRDHKPFAIMAGNIETIRKLAHVSADAEAVLKSTESPIVLLPKKSNEKLAPAVAEGVSTYGFMLCYAPLHHLLFAKGPEVLVMTSANISDSPLICKNDEAIEKLGRIADAFVMHDRDIYRQVDDSIVHFIDNTPVLLRRARGFVPSPVLSDTATRHDIFAAGSDLKNTFCLAKENQLICSEHIGDLEDAEVYQHYVRSAKHLKGLFEVEPEVIVCDLHPGYLSTSYSKKTGKKILQVQHHWAHTASVLAENNLTGPVIGLNCDGTGYGTDGAVWGCECMIASLDGFERFGHLDYFSLGGGDKASKEAIRPLLGLITKAYGEEFELDDFGWLLEPIEPDKIKRRLIAEQIEKQINTVQTSSLGRVFDAVAAAIGLGNYNYFEAQLPIALEAIAKEDIEEHYAFEITGQGPAVIDISIMIKEIINDIHNKVEPGVISSKFHNCIAEALISLAEKARGQSGIETVAISGGVFCNRYLANRVIKGLRKSDFEVLFNKLVPSNDGGIALGQAAIAARRL